ncbi:MAG TPA: YfhO family protein, partial [Capsulimonadaceae bacterium]|nr:YfhO family protein [Capsulimonadaceae bacterium]
NVGVSSNYLYPPTDETKFVSANLGDGRVLCLSDGDPSHAQSRLVPNSAMSLGWRDISGSDPLLLASYDRFLSALNVAQSNAPAPAGEGIVADAGNPALDRLNVKYIIAPRALPNTNYKLVQPGDINIYENPNAVGEARFTNHVWTAGEGRDLQILMKMPPPDNEVDVHGDWGGMILDMKAPLGGPPKVLSRAPGRILISASTPSNTLLVTSEIYDPGWQVTDNSVPVKPLIADTVFIALPVTAGAHLISLRYLPPAVQFGLYLTCLAWLIFAVLMVRDSYNPSAKRVSKPRSSSG